MFGPVCVCVGVCGYRGAEKSQQGSESKGQRTFMTAASSSSDRNQA